PEDASPFVDSLLANEDYTEKVSHSFLGDGFVRAEGVVAGVTKTRKNEVTNRFCPFTINDYLQHLKNRRTLS
ncbi:hypothetical protein ABGT22_25060, partial [Peribacillus frigoritolerans]